LGRGVIVVNLAATSWLWKFLLAHQISAMAGAAYASSWMFSAYASQLKAPLPLGNRFYSWWYAVAHLAAANLDRFTGKK
jgi:hypothetical protein